MLMGVEVKGLLVGPCALFRGHFLESLLLSRGDVAHFRAGKVRLHRGEVARIRSCSQPGPLVVGRHPPIPQVAEPVPREGGDLSRVHGGKAGS